MQLEWIVGPLLVAVAAVIMSRFYDLRRVDDPVVYAFAFMSVFWIAGVGLGSLFPDAPQLEPQTVWLLGTGYVSFVLGAVAATRIRSRSGWRARYARLQPVRPLSSLEVRLMVGVLGAGLALVATFVVIAGGIPLLMENAEQARVDRRAGLGYLVISAIWLLSLPTVALVSHARLRSAGAAGVVFMALVSAVGLSILGNRAPPLRMLIGAGWVALTSTGRLPRWRTLVGIGAGAIVVLAVAIVLRTGGEVTVRSVVNRVEWQMYVNPSNLERLVDLIPREVPHLLGYGYLIDLAVLIPGPQVNFGTWLKEVMGLEFAGGGLTIGLVGEIYANWGPVAAAVLPALIAVVLATVRGYVTVDSPLDAAYVILLSLSLGGVVQSGVMTPMLYNVIPLSGLYLAMRIAADRLQTSAVAT